MQLLIGNYLIGRGTQDLNCGFIGIPAKGFVKTTTAARTGTDAQKSRFHSAKITGCRRVRGLARDDCVLSQQREVNSARWRSLTDLKIGHYKTLIGHEPGRSPD